MHTEITISILKPHSRQQEIFEHLRKASNVKVRDQSKKKVNKKEFREHKKMSWQKEHSKKYIIIFFSEK